MRNFKEPESQKRNQNQNNINSVRDGETAKEEEKKRKSFRSSSNNSGVFVEFQT